MARYFVAGATGFLGSHLVKGLVDDGHEVVAVSRGGGRVAGVRVEELDVLDTAAVAVRARGCDGAFLATGKVSRDPGDAEELHRTNVLGTRHALAGVRQAGVRRVVHVSTSGTLGISTDAGDVADESTPPPLELIAKWPYYRTKYYAELEALEANDPPAFDVVVVNPSLLLGPGDGRGSSTSDVRRFLDGEILAVPRGGLALVDVRDAARGAIAAMEHGRAGERYVLSAANLSVSAFFDRLSRISGVPSPRLPLPRSGALAVGATRLFGKVVKSIGGELPMDAASVDMAQHYWYCDAGKAERELGFSPRDVTDTLRDTVADLVDRGAANPRSGTFAGGVPTALGSGLAGLLPGGGDV
jgi:dihydroflavonol-4-reductase